MFGIFKKLLAPLKIIVKMVLAVIQLVLKLITMLDVIFDPIKLIQLLVKLTIALMMFLLAMLDILGTVSGVFGFCMYLVYAIVMTIFRFVLMVFNALIFIIDNFPLWRGFFRHFLYNWIAAREEDIRNWYMLSSYEKGNSPGRLITAMAPCSDNYKPHGFLCKRINERLPLFSIHANIYRLKNGEDLKGKIFPTPIIVTQKFKNFSKRNKQNFIRKENKSLQQYHENMNSTMKPYEQMTKNTCQNLEKLDEDDISLDDKAIVEQLCNARYCRDGKFEPFCVSLDNISGNIYKKDLIENYLQLGTYGLVIFMLLSVTILTFNIDFEDFKNYIGNMQAP
jgi:hypothetical protein